MPEVSGGGGGAQVADFSAPDQWADQANCSFYKGNTYFTYPSNVTLGPLWKVGAGVSNTNLKNGTYITSHDAINQKVYVSEKFKATDSSATVRVYGSSNSQGMCVPATPNPDQLLGAQGWKPYPAVAGMLNVDSVSKTDSGNTVVIASPGTGNTSVSVGDTSVQITHNINNIATTRFNADHTITYLGSPGGAEVFAAVGSQTRIGVQTPGAIPAIVIQGGGNGVSISPSMTIDGSINFRAASMGPNSTSAAVTCGSSTERFSAFWGVNGTIQTSDQRYKTPLQPLPQALLDVWREHVRFGQWRWLKDDNGTHAGIIAQDVIAAFDAAGLDWREWHLVHEDKETGQLSVSMTEVLAIEAAVQRARVDALLAKGGL